MEIKKEIDIKDELFYLKENSIKSQDDRLVCEMYDDLKQEIYLIDKDGNKKMTLDYTNNIYYNKKDGIIIGNGYSHKIEFYDSNFNLINTFECEEDFKIREGVCDDTEFVLLELNDSEDNRRFCVLNKKGQVVVNNLNRLPAIYSNFIKIELEDDFKKSVYIAKNGTERLYKIKSVLGTTIYKDKKTKKRLDTAAVCENSIVYRTLLNKHKQLYGVLNDNLEEIIESKYSDIQPLSDDYYLVEKQEKYGILDKDGNTILDIKYDFISLDNENDIIKAHKNYDYDFYDSTTGKLLYEGKNNLKFCDNGVYDRKFKTYVDYKDKKVYKLDEDKEYKAFLSNGISLYYDEDNVNVGLYNYRTSEYVTDAIYKYDYLCGDYNDYILLEKDRKYGILDKEGNVLVPFGFEYPELEYIFGNLFSIKNKLVNVRDIKFDYKVSLYDDEDKLIISKSFDNKDEQEKIYEYFNMELDKNNKLISEREQLYLDILLEYVDRKDRDFRRQFRDSKTENVQNYSVLTVPKKKPFIISKNSDEDIQDCSLEDEEFNIMVQEFEGNNLKTNPEKKLIKSTKKVNNK